MAFVWEQCKFGELVDKYEDLVETPTDGYMRLGIRSHAKGTFYSYVEKGKELETAKMFRVAANNFIVNITFGWEHAVAITDENDAGKLVSHRFPQYQFHKGMIPKFFKYLILDESFKHHLELSSPGGAGRNRVLKLNDMLNYQMRFPSEQEQKKVANYFDTLDTLITLHQRKRMLRKCFFSIDWEQRKFGSLLNEIREKTTIENEDTLLSCAIDGMYLNSELFSHFRGQSNIGYLKVKKNDLILSAQNLHLGNCNVNLRFEHGIISPAYKVYELVDCNPLFVQAWIKMDKTKDFFLKSSTEGASVCRKNILWEELYKQELVVPAIEEQTVIGTYFEQFDQLITLHQCKSNFCKKNEVNAWEQRKLGDVLETIKDGTHGTHQDANEGPLLLSAKNIRNGTIIWDESDRRISINEYEKIHSKFKLKKNDVLLTIVGSIGETAILKDISGITFQRSVAFLRTSEQITPEFLCSEIQTQQFQKKLNDRKSTSAQPGIYLGDLSEIPFVYSKNKDEQVKIGQYFSNLDKLITLHQWECNINENTEGNDEKQRKPIKKLIISEGNLSLVDDMFLLHRMTFLVCNKYILLRLNVVKYKITIIIISNILYSIVSLLIIACYLIVINKQLIILIYVEISVVIIKGDDDYARIRS